MSGKYDASAVAEGGGQASRRSLVRGAAHAAWAVPAVALATEAPAQAATSTGHPQLVVSRASYYVAKAASGSKAKYWLIPGITIDNPTDRDPYGVTLTLQFPLASFNGAVPGTPPVPYYNSIGSLTGDGDGNVTASKPPGRVDVAIWRFTGPAPGSPSAPGAITIGSFAPWASARGALGWTNSPTASVAYTVTPGSSVFPTITGLMPLVAAPTS